MKMAPSGQISSSSSNTARFASTFSAMLSMMKSAPVPASSTDWVGLMRATMPSTSPAGTMPCSTKVPRFARTTDSAFSKVSAFLE